MNEGGTVVNKESLLQAFIRKSTGRMKPHFKSRPLLHELMGL